MHVLSIGNSFSQDAQRYLHRIAKEDGEKISAFNLYIGGCTLSQHYTNILSEERSYELEVNGMSTGFPVSVKEALLNREWDVVTLQQASYLSVDYDTFQPYLDKIARFIRTCLPKTKLVIHQTWAYEEGSEKLCDVLGYRESAEMLHDVKAAYQKAAEAIQADSIIPSGELFQKLLENGISKVHRDTFHASLGLGRYALGLLWYRVLTGQDISDNSFSDLDEAISRKEVQIVKQSVSTVCEAYGL